MILRIKKILKNILIKVGYIKETPKPFFTKDFFNSPNFIIGEYTYGKPDILFADSGSKLIIGKFCSIAKDVTIFLGGEHRTDWVSTYPFNIIFKDDELAKNITGHPKTKGDVIIGHDVWIGDGATILSGVKIGNGAVIASKSVVTKDIGDYEIWGGNPARLIKKRFDEQKIQQLLAEQWWDKDINEVLENVSVLCSKPN